MAEQGGGYALPPNRCSSEDILFCINVGPETMTEMKVKGFNGRHYTRLNSIKQAILLFVYAKLTTNPLSLISYGVLAKSTHWLRKEFSCEVDSTLAALRDISVDSSSNYTDLTHLFCLATLEAKKSHAQN